MTEMREKKVEKEKKSSKKYEKTRQKDKTKKFSVCLAVVFSN